MGKSKDKELKEYEKRREAIDRVRKAILKKRPWLESDRENEVEEDALDYIAEQYSEDLPKSSLEVQCLKGLSPKQKMVLRGRISEDEDMYFRNGAEIEVYLINCAKEAFSRRDYTFPLIYRYLTDLVISKALEIE